jgi:hypothetical protein
MPSESTHNRRDVVYAVVSPWRSSAEKDERDGVLIEAAIHQFHRQDGRWARQLASEKAS